MGELLLFLFIIAFWVGVHAIGGWLMVMAVIALMVIMPLVG